MLIVKKKCIIVYHFIACNRALCCSGLRGRILSMSGQIQIVQMVVSLWTITFVTGAYVEGEGKESTAKANQRNTFPSQRKRTLTGDSVYHWNVQSSRHRSVSCCYTARLERLRSNRRLEVIFWDAPYIPRSVDRNDYADSVGRPEENPDINEVASLTLIVTIVAFT